MIGELIDTMANIEYGIMIAIIIVALLLFILASLNNKKKLNVLSFIIAALLLVLLSFQMSRLVSACELSNATSAINDLVGYVSPEYKDYVASVSSRPIGWFIFRRVIWSVLFTAIAGFCIYMTMDVKRTRNHAAPSGAQIGRKYTSSTSRRRR